MQFKLHKLSLSGPMPTGIKNLPSLPDKINHGQQQLMHFSTAFQNISLVLSKDIAEMLHGGIFYVDVVLCSTT